MKDRIDALARGVQGGIFAPNEARNMEGLDKVHFGNEPRLQQQVVPIVGSSSNPTWNSTWRAWPNAAVSTAGRRATARRIQSRRQRSHTMTMFETHSDNFSPPPDGQDDIIVDALHEALGEVIAQHRATWQRERALIEAQAARAQAEADRTVALMQTKIIELESKFDALMHQKLVEATALIQERLALVRDGAPGAPGVKGDSGDRGEEGPQGPRGTRGERGQDGTEGKEGKEGKAGRPARAATAKRVTPVKKGPPAKKVRQVRKGRRGATA